MNKSRILKFSVAMAVILLVAVAFALSIVASPTIKVTYNYGSQVYQQYAEAGVEFTPLAPNTDPEDTYYGWSDGNGNFYEAGKKLSLNESTTLYLVAGPSVSSAEEFLAAIEDGKTYVKLNSNITVNSQINLKDGVFYIDTNGYTLNIRADGNGIIGNDVGLYILGGGVVKHQSTNLPIGPVVNSLISLSPRASYNSLFVLVDKDTSVITNVDFISFDTNISAQDGVFDAFIYGNLSCHRLMRTRGISNATLDFYEGSMVTVNGEFFFEDIGNGNSDLYATLTIYGGKHTVNGLNGSGKDQSKYKVAILGGAFSRDIAPCFEKGNYSFTLDANTGYYNFASCVHNGAAVDGIPKTCTEPATITYECTYCTATYTKSFPDGIGHSMATSLERELITTEKVTQAGLYKTYCQKCDEKTTYQAFYPDPNEVYVSVIVLDAKGREQTLRVLASELYTFDKTNKTQANSFSTEYIQYNYNITQENIISVEVPLGTTDIHGGFTHNAGVGLFCENPHLRQVVLPESLVNVQKYAFNNMPLLTSIVGIEHISGSIGERAFSQNHTNVFIDQLTVNAKSISNYAFNNIRMNAITFGKNVTTISGGSFHLDPGFTPCKEVFIEGYQSGVKEGLTVSVAMSNAGGKSYSAGSQQFGSSPIVFDDHQYEITVKAPTCYEAGYTLYDCKFCGNEKKDDFKSVTSHEFKNVTVPPTCLTQGYSVVMCINCKDEKPDTKVVDKPRDPNAHDFSYDRGYLFIDGQGMPFENGSICVNSYCIISKCKCGAFNYPELKTAYVISPNGAHDYDTENMKVIKEANCGEYGIAEYSCKVCNNKIEAPIPITGDNHKWDSGTVILAPTCTETGIREFRCTICNGASGVKQTKINKDLNNHAWNEGFVEREPTEMVSGVMRYTCTRCNESFTEGINKLPPKQGLPIWAIILFSVGGVLLVGGIVLTLYFTLFKKKRASDGYKYKFNTLGK
ncbi:MAG: leucine-rich repeat protein [Clostridia bacterium]|nr:leucine-rich repeat protein [Clostridia bacterium]